MITIFCVIIRRLNNRIGPILFKLFLCYLFLGLEDNCLINNTYANTHML